MGNCVIINTPSQLGIFPVNKNGFLYGDVVLPMTVTHLGPVLKGNQYIYSVNMPGTIQTIEGDAFRDCSHLTDVFFSNNITSIGDYAFSNCTSLVEINFPENLTLIGNYAFSNCDSLIEINFPENLTSIGNYVFSNCGSLVEVTLPNNFPIIKKGYGMFSDCSKLKQINLPEETTIIPSGFLSNCVALESIDTKKATIFKNSCFRDCYNLKNIDLNFEEGEFISIGLSAFSGCQNLSNEVIKKLCLNISDIGRYAFEGCLLLENIEIENLLLNSGSFIDWWYTFQECKNLKTFLIKNFPSEFTFRFNGTFANCSSLKQVTLPEGTVELSSSCFKNCSSLEEIILPSSIEKIGGNCFKYCPSLQNIVLGSDWNCSLYLNNSEPLPIEVLINMFNNLKDLTGEEPKTIGLEPWDISNLTEEQKNIALNKNWVLV